MPDSPAFQFYPGDWLGSASVTVLTLEQEGAYMRLLCYCWRDGYIPADPEKLVRLIGKEATVEMVTTLIPLFKINKRNPDKLFHARLDLEREKQSEWRKKSSEGGKKSAAKRWGKASSDKITKDKGGYEMLSTVVNDCLQPNGNSSSSSSSSVQESTHIARVEFAIPSSEQEAIEWATPRGVLPDFARMVYHQCEARGWVEGTGQKIRSWSSYVQSRFLKERFNQPPAARREGGGKKEPSVYELQSVIKAKESKASELKRKYCSEVAMGDTWNDQEKRQEYFRLRKEIREVNEKISQMA